MQSLNLDSKVLRFFAHLADLILLSFLFVIFCIPIVTIGPATTALYGVFRNPDSLNSNILHVYWRQFRSHFRPSVICWLLQLFINALLIFDIYLLRRVDTEFSSYLLFLSFLLLLLCNLIGSLVYPQIAYYQNTILRYWLNAFLLFLSKFWLTIPNALLFILPEIVLFVWPQAYFFCLIIRFFLVIGIQFYLSFLIVRRLFQLVSPTDQPI